MTDINGAGTAKDTIDQFGGCWVDSPGLGRGSEEVTTDAEPTCCQHGSITSSPSPVSLNPDGSPDDIGSTDCAATVISPSITPEAHLLTPLSAKRQGEPSAEQRSPRALPVPGRFDPSQPCGSCDPRVDSHSDSESCYDSRSDSHSEPGYLSGSDGSGQQGDLDYYPESGTGSAQSDSPSSDSDDSSVPGRRKRCKLDHSDPKSKSQYRTGRNSCHNLSRPQTGGSHLLGSRRSSPANSHASDVRGTKFEEWPLSDVVLKRITIQGRATFQLQFEWDPCLVEHQPGRAKCNSRSTRRTRKVCLDGRVPAKRAGFTKEEDDLLRELKEQDLPWA